MCPHCGRSLAQCDQLSDDHIVSKFLGGTWTVPACKTCNDVLGNGVEGRLFKGSWLTVLSQDAGLTSGWVYGRNEHGQKIRQHFGRGGAYEWQTPRVVANTDQERYVTIAVPPHAGANYIKGLEKKYGGQARVVDRVSAPVEWVTVNSNLSMYDLRRLTAKSALCAGAHLWGDVFLHSPAAQWLRVVLDVGGDWPKDRTDGPASSAEPHAGGRWSVTPEDFEFMRRQVEPALAPALARAAGVTGGSAPLPPPQQPIVGFDSADNGRAFDAWVYALRVMMPPLRVPHPLPTPRQ